MSQNQILMPVLPQPRSPLASAADSSDELAQARQRGDALLDAVDQALAALGAIQAEQYLQQTRQRSGQ